MSALKFRDRIRIEAPPEIDPATGLPGEAWTLVDEVGAKIEDTKPGKTDATQQGLRLAHDTATVWIRYRDGITSDMRIVELTRRRRTLSITGGPASISGGRELEFTVEKFSS
ncbi:MAG: head-tail adaptor protein [Janthinobacterium sp.]